MARSFCRSGFWLLACLAAAHLSGCAAANTASRTTTTQANAAAAKEAARVAADLARLQTAFDAAVPDHLVWPPARNAEWIRLTRAALTRADVTIDRPQLLVTVDRNPAVQELALILAEPGTGQATRPWTVLGGTHVSTGQAGRRGYFITPRGVFLHDASILDYRALGTYNENHIRGLGVTGMRVWDFGWQSARRGWVPVGGRTDIRLLMHATDPDVLEQRIGRPASKGCIRIPAAMNRFLDKYGVLDAEYEKAAETDPAFRAVLRDDRTPTPLAGDLLVIVDSAAPSRS